MGHKGRGGRKANGCKGQQKNLPLGVEFRELLSAHRLHRTEGATFSDEAEQTPIRHNTEKSTLIGYPQNACASCLRSGDTGGGAWVLTSLCVNASRREEAVVSIMPTTFLEGKG